MIESLERAALAALMCPDPHAKRELATRLERAWLDGQLRATGEVAPRIAQPGRPVRPRLVPPDAVPRRGIGTPEGHAALIHAVTHIEFNAINLALDCVLRFAAQGPD